MPIEGFRNEEEFQEFTDKSVVYLCLKLLQKQQVWSLDDKTGKCCGRNDIKKSTRSDDMPLKSNWNFSINDFIQRK
ncbi:hypothetical protein [Clostridium ljungdahlii]